MRFPYSRVLVTGASGFIGAALCRRLSALGVGVVGTARSPRERLSPDVQWRFGDLSNVEFVRTLIRDERPEAIFHLASFVSGNRSRDVVLEAFHSNLTSVVNLLTVADEVSCRRVILTGSLEEPEPGSIAPPSSPYAAAKWAADGYARMFHALYGLSVVTARLFMVYGPAQRDRKKLIPFVIESFLRGEVPPLASGAREVDWIYVDDVIDAYIALAIADGVDGASVDIGSGQLITIRRVVEEIENLMGPAVAPGWGALPERPLERVRVADVATTKERIGWEPKRSLRDGLSQTISWYRENPHD